MAKKAAEQTKATGTAAQAASTPASTADDAFADTADNDLGEGIDSDFDLEQEFKPTPLIPSGTYHASVTDVKINPADKTIDWTFALGENGGLMTDGETAIDGNQIGYRNWLPIPGDETDLVKKGNMTKRQAKINMLTQFASNMKINMNTGAIIATAIENSEWIGLAVDLQIGTREYEGRVFNDIKRISAR